MTNLFDPLPTSLAEELVTVLASNSQVRVERIVSMGHASPPGFWYDQEEHEWVALLQGEAKLIFEDGTALTMRPGDHLLIDAHQRHRVESTSSSRPTVWLGVFFRNEE
ncbi:cupin domain-containing protein [Novipirellula artificiosorum]|uniref:cupin domain-containing protein n=1 Tax=Novipirellula artificiosorum TaxID=2528016 RepID=UPI0011B6C8B7|nr:cupin domain-containing protein [Novipirellula artificiosorum]